VQQDGLRDRSLSGCRRYHSSEPLFDEIIRDIRAGSQTRANGMNPLDDDNVNQDENEDRADSKKPKLVPDDLDIAEGEEEKGEETDMPPAMPPKV
jgi:hypothetical protein